MDAKNNYLNIVFFLSFKDKNVGID